MKPGRQNPRLVEFISGGITHMVRAIFISFLFLLVGCVEHPDQPPTVQELAGTWIPVNHELQPPTRFLRLSMDHTFIATNFPLYTSRGKVSRSGSGIWKLDEYLNVKIEFPDEVLSLEVQRGKSPFLLEGGLDTGDKDLRAQRLEDLKQ